jgi:cytochrome c nitrite reductase small subunit
MRRAIPIVLGVSLGAAIGLGAYTFVYAKGASYLTNDPMACGNCHVMDEQVSAWMKSPHRSAATCNDCHAPHDVVGKYTTKALNGFRHSLMFTTGRFPEPIRITARNRSITEHACRGCHEEIVEPITALDGGNRGDSGHADSDLSCIRCHGSVGHLH